MPAYQSGQGCNFDRLELKEAGSKAKLTYQSGQVTKPGSTWLFPAQFHQLGSFSQSSGNTISQPVTNIILVLQILICTSSGSLRSVHILFMQAFHAICFDVLLTHQSHIPKLLITMAVATCILCAGDLFLEQVAATINPSNNILQAIMEVCSTSQTIWTCAHNYCVNCLLHASW